MKLCKRFCELSFGGMSDLSVLSLPKGLNGAIVYRRHISN